MRKFLLSVLISSFLSVFVIVQTSLAADNILKPGHPERYIVKKGDTLWDISSVFLDDAWRWPEIWHINPEIENPHLIYPGDVIMLRYVGGKPQLSISRGEAARTVKLSPPTPVNKDLKLKPKIRSSSLTSAIPAIPLDAIVGFLNHGRIVERDTLEQAPYILAGKDGRLIFGSGDRIYARGDWPDNEPPAFGIFRKGEVYIDPETKEILGFEAVDVGMATVKRRKDDLYTLMLNEVREDIRLGYRLLPTEERKVESTFFPKSPSQKIDGLIIAILGGISYVGKNDVVAINRGTAHSLEVGDVLSVHKVGSIVRDTIGRGRVQLPSERAGIMMVFRVFDNMSYALVLETEEALKRGDIVQNP